MKMKQKLHFHNTLTRTKEAFAPADAENVRLYVCGPTVYDFAHIGNARPVIVFDVLVRLLRHAYGARHVTYVRNITDVDDKINARALDHFGEAIKSGKLTLNAAIGKITAKTTAQFHEDAAALCCLPPDFEPRATQHIDGMVEMINALLGKGHAYIATGKEGTEILFDIASMDDYGALSGRRLDEQKAGARVAVEAHKKNPGDFVLWKQSASDQPGWQAEFGGTGEAVSIFGRPGWHIECSVMSKSLLGERFDIHGGGLDLIFPHHENEIAQSRCAHGTPEMAKTWMHNGFLQVEGRKMSKSEGNFITINQLLREDHFGGRKWEGEVLRLAMLMTHYREPIDFSVRKLEEAENMLAKWPTISPDANIPEAPVNSDFLTALGDDLNTVEAVRILHQMAQQAARSDDAMAEYQASAALIGLLREEKPLEGINQAEIETAIAKRLEHLAARDFQTADRIRDELAAKNIQLKDGKDENGNRITNWEIKS